MDQDYPVRFEVEYPDRPLNRLTSALRIFTVIPILIVLATLAGGPGGWRIGDGDYWGAGAGGAGGALLFLPPLLMLAFAEKCPRWWFDWNQELLRFFSRVWTYLASILVVVLAWFAILFTGRYPRGIFEFVEGVFRWHTRVVAYAIALVTDRYPPFRLSP